jgi:glucans biosynthesis protein C
MRPLTPKTERIYAIDLLRAILMLLGIVLHSALTFAPYGIKTWTLKDPDTHLAFDVLVDFIHTFRMPIFFFISGFFAALLFFEKGPSYMFINRIKRIALPFLAALLIIFPVTVWFAFYAQMALAGQGSSFSVALHITIEHLSRGNITTIHLWFLYYLMIFCVLGWGLSLVTQHWLKSPVSALVHYFGRILRSGWAPIVFSGFTFCSLFIMGSHSFITTNAFIVDKAVLFAYGVFFTFGWLLYHHRGQLFRFTTSWGWYLSAGLLLYFCRLGILSMYLPDIPVAIIVLLMGLQALVIWLLLFGITGWFIKRFNRYSRLGRYISDASYWVYLLHLPFTILFPGLLAGLPLGAFIKFCLVVGATTAVTFSTYDLFVRNSFIGKFLNGRKYNRGLPEKRSEATVL